MSDILIAAFITGGCAIIAAVIGYCGTYRILRLKNSICFLDETEDFRDILRNSTSICTYTVNSYELLNELNSLLERNQNIDLNEVKILVRRKENECESDIYLLNNIISNWKNLVDRKRIKRLLIIGYDHNPDHYYTIIDDKIAFSGQVLFDKTKPTGTTINYSPLVFRGHTRVGKQVILNYQNHFNNTIKEYEEKLKLFSSE